MKKKKKIKRKKYQLFELFLSKVFGTQDTKLEVVFAIDC